MAVVKLSPANMVYTPFASLSKLGRLDFLLCGRKGMLLFRWEGMESESKSHDLPRFSSSCSIFHYFWILFESTIVHVVKASAAMVKISLLFLLMLKQWEHHTKN